MAARKGKGRQAVRNSSSGFPSWAGVLVGILIGAVVVVMLMRHSLMPMSAKNGPQPNPQATAQQDSDTGLQPSASAPAKPKYDFYSVLSEKEVRIPDAEISAQAKAEQQQKQLAAQQALQPAATPQPAANAPAAVSQNVTAAPPSTVQPAAAGNGYLLQVGAFPDAADAESLKAKLALQGFVANVQAVDVGGQTYHRVRLGPYRSATDLEAVKQRLSAAGIKAIALKEGR
jgi:cell division protein FtsN